VAEPRLASIPATVWRVGRASAPLRFSEITPDDSLSVHGGNRFDVPGGRVLYAATEPDGAYAETLARFRPTARMRRIRPQSDEHLMAVGSVPADWRERRRMVSFGLHDPLPFLDVDAPETHTYLTRMLPTALEDLGLGNLDVSDLRGRDRRLTRLVALFAFTARDEGDDYRFAGIRYESRLGPHECWAVFDPAEIVRDEVRAIRRDDRELQSVARRFDLTIH